MNEPEIMTLEEVAEYLRVSERTVYDWIQKGEIPGGKIGTSWRFKRSDIVEWVNRKMGNTANSTKNTLNLNLNSLLTPDRILIMDDADKKSIIQQLVSSLAATEFVESPDDLMSGIIAREQLMSTGIGFGLAIPHVRLPSIKNICMAAAVVHNGVSDYETIDDEQVKLVFMIIAGETQHTSHLKLLSQLSAKLKNPLRRARLCDAVDNFHFYEILNSDIQ